MSSGMIRMQREPTSNAVSRRNSSSKQQTASKAMLEAYCFGAALPELKEMFGINGKANLARILLDSKVGSGKFPPVKRKNVRYVLKEFAIAVNKRWTIVLPKNAVVDVFKMQVGQQLVVRKRGTWIVLGV